MRLPDWQKRLSEYIVRCTYTPFQYGSQDCGLFVAGAIEAMTGVDVAAQLRGRYTTRTTAFKAIGRMCGQPTMAAAADHLARIHGFQEVQVPFAQRGDAVQIRNARLASLGLVAMHGTEILMPYDDGLLRMPLTYATRAWRID
jgi:hypothetical protein